MLGKRKIVQQREKWGEHLRWRDWAEAAEVGRSPMTWGGKAPSARGGDWRIWGSGGSLGDGEWGAGAEVGSLMASEMNSHRCVGCPWEGNWTKDPCPPSGLECVWLILGKLSEKHTNP